jgi:hypothetical protein
VDPAALEPAVLPAPALAAEVAPELAPGASPLLQADSANRAEVASFVSVKAAEIRGMNGSCRGDGWMRRRANDEGRIGRNAFI